MLLWAGQHGKAEEFMDALNSAHFQDAKTASDRTYVLGAAETAGLDVGAAAAFLDTNEFEDTVWQVNILINILKSQLSSHVT